MNYNLPNGGFPPIKFCDNNKEKDIKLTKERHFSSSIKNINIRKILNNNTKKPLIIIDDKENDINYLEEV